MQRKFKFQDKKNSFWVPVSENYPKEDEVWQTERKPTLLPRRPHAHLTPWGERYHKASQHLLVPPSSEPFQPLISWVLWQNDTRSLSLRSPLFSRDVHWNIYSWNYMSSIYVIILSGQWENSWNKLVINWQIFEVGYGYTKEHIFSSFLYVLSSISRVKNVQNEPGKNNTKCHLRWVSHDSREWEIL